MCVNCTYLKLEVLMCYILITEINVLHFKTWGIKHASYYYIYQNNSTGNTV